MSIVGHPSGAFCRDNHAALHGAPSGPLRGLTFAAKDVFDIAGHRTGFGNPDWLRTHPPAAKTAPAVQVVLDAGADMLGRTHTDELTYSLSGENVHYGTPLNPAAPDRVPGGSSSGSASAVAAGVVDFSLGSDCGGSVRLPASYCGILGMRPTHDRITLDGVVPFAPSFDVAGWFARSPEVFERVGAVLLGEDAEPVPLSRALIGRDGFAMLDPAVAEALAPAVARVTALLPAQDVTVSPEGLEAWMESFRVIQGAEIWASHRDWIRSEQPTIGPAIAERLRIAEALTPDEIAAARAAQAKIRARIDALIGPGDVLVLPTSPRIAPLKGTGQAALEVTYRFQAMCLLCIAGHGGLPQISLPLAQLDGCPLGLSIVGRKGSDRALLGLARTIMEGAG